MNLPGLILAIFVALPLSACALSGGPVSGRVLEEGTDKPIPGTIVVVRWQGYVSSLVDSQGVCVHVDSMITDEQGRYKFTRWSKPSKVGPVFDLEPAVSAYKIGYGYPQTPSQKDEVTYLAPFKGAREERLEYLERMARSSGCDSAGESRRNLYPLYEALHYEAKVNVAKEDDLQWYRRMAAKISVGVNDQLTHAENEKRIEQFLREHLK